MVKYEYNPEIEMFRRVDNKGPSLKVNIVEARRIESMMQLGIKAPTIMKKIDFVNNISMTNLRTIMSNIEQGNLKLEGDYPAPVATLDEMSIDARMDRLEEDLEEFKEKYLNNECTCDCDNDCSSDSDSFVGKVKKWIVRK